MPPHDDTTTVTTTVTTTTSPPPAAVSSSASTTTKPLSSRTSAPPAAYSLRSSTKRSSSSSSSSSKEPGRRDEPPSRRSHHHHHHHHHRHHHRHRHHSHHHRHNQEEVDQKDDPNHKNIPTTNTRKRRRSRRGPERALQQLAQALVTGQRVVMITGAGLSVASGIRPFRSRHDPLQPAAASALSSSWPSSSKNNKRSKTSQEKQQKQQQQPKHLSARQQGLDQGLWQEVIWTTATRESFRKDPVRWYNDFWIPHFAGCQVRHYPNAAHLAMEALLDRFPVMRQITQNMDGLQAIRFVVATSSPDPSSSTPGAPPPETTAAHPSRTDPPLIPQIIEAHGRVGLYKCLPLEGSSEDDDEDDDDDDDDEDHSDDKDQEEKKEVEQVDGSGPGIPGPSAPRRTSDRRTVVTLGNRRKARQQRQLGKDPTTCPYQYVQSLTSDQLQPDAVRRILLDYDTYGQCRPGRRQTQEKGGAQPAARSKNPNNNDDDDDDDDDSINNYKKKSEDFDHKEAIGNNSNSDHDEDSPRLSEAPTCPVCGGLVMPQALLFDEGYHAHSHYQFEMMEEWIHQAQVLVFVGTSFAVQLTQVALAQAREAGLPVYNFNLYDALEPTARLNATNIIGPADETLLALVAACDQVEQELAGTSSSY